MARFKSLGITSVISLGAFGLAGCVGSPGEELFGGTSASSMGTGGIGAGGMSAASSSGAGGMSTASSSGAGGMSAASSSGAGGMGAASSSAGVGGMGAASSSAGVGGGAASSSAGVGGGAASSSASASSASASASSASASSSSGGISCGNGVREGAEECDGMDFGPSSCVNYGYSSAAGLACTAMCTIDSAGCMATCDSVKLEPGEVCDGVDLGGQNCTNAGYVNPAGATCASCQSVDTSGCQATCDGVALEPGEACDGAFLNGKTCADFSYANPAGLTCVACSYDTSGCTAVCGNNKVEPGEACDDGNAASYDGCSAACQTEGPGTVCKTAIPVALNLGTTTINGTTVGGGSHADSGASCTSAGADLIYAVKPSVGGFITATLPRNATLYDSVLYVSTACSDIATNTSLLCADSQDPNNIGSLQGGEVVSFYAIANTTYYLFVDGRSTQGAFQLTIDLSSGANCNDPVPLSIWPGSGMTLLGTNVGAGADTTSQNCGGIGQDVVYQVDRQGVGALKVDVSVPLTNYNTSIYARSVCNSQNSELACQNLNGNSAAETFTLPNVNATVFVYVDGSAMGGGQNFGTYGIVLTP